MKSPKVQLSTLMVLGLLTLSNAYEYERCELARELSRYFPRDQLADWICLVRTESVFRTDAINPSNTDGSTDYGLFQINDRYWCQGNYPGGKNVCGINCQSILHSGLDYQINCVKTIYRAHGFGGWVGWQRHCSNGRSPSVDDCFNTRAYYFTMEYDHLPELLGNGLDLKFK